MITRLAIATTESHRRCELFLDHLQLRADALGRAAIVGGFGFVELGAELIATAAIFDLGALIKKLASIAEVAGDAQVIFSFPIGFARAGHAIDRIEEIEHVKLLARMFEQMCDVPQPLHILDAKRPIAMRDGPDRVVAGKNAGW